MEKLVFCFFFSLFALIAEAQKPKLAKFWVEFTDKKDSPFSIFRPAEFLSPRAMARREKSGVSIVENDLPVNSTYLDSLKAFGLKVHNVSKWLNAATVLVDSSKIRGIEKFSFVKKVEFVGWHLTIKNQPNLPLKTRKPLSKLPPVRDEDPYYGYAGIQNNLLEISLLHNYGARGQGILVAVMDGGFTNVDDMNFFDSVAVRNRLFSAWDFVERDNYVFESSGHGTAVLSVMASNLPGYFVGTAPEATYLCLKTEDTGGEYIVEEANWIAGAEFADSIGADIINASLGYTVFTDKSLNHNYLQLDGRSTIGSRGATIAAQKGMLIFNSAGNQGDEEWHFIGVPSDAPGIIAVGATTYNNEKASFSSFGPSADGRIKPDFAAPGEMVVAAGNSGIDLGFSSGTSIASPMLAGAVASLWSAFPEKNAGEILAAVFESANQADRPDNKLGYGIPNMARAWFQLKKFIFEDRPNIAGGGIFSFDRNTGELCLIVIEKISRSDKVVLRNVFGKEISPKSLKISDEGIPLLTFSGLENLPPGFYRIEISQEGQRRQHRSLAW